MTSRYIQLDSLRGIAALSVFFSHAIGMIPIDEIFLHSEGIGLIMLNSVWSFFFLSPMHALFDGEAAVNLFFVLSGFCLSLPYLNKRNQKKLRIKEFIVRRIFRIYPAYIFAILFAIFLKNIYQYPSAEYISEWGGTFFRWDTIPLKEYIYFLSLILNFDTKLLNPPSWSLVIEMRMAIIMPLFILLTKMDRIKGKFLLYVIFLMVALYIKISLYGIITYGPLFFLGIFIAKYLEIISIFINQCNKIQFFCLCIIGILFYTSRFPWQTVFHIASNNLSDGVFRYLSGIGSSIIIICFFRKGIERLFNNKIGAFLGKISYGLYLVHFPVLLIVFSLKVSVIIEILLGLIISVIVACFVYKYIENPGILIGKNMATRL